MLIAAGKIARDTSESDVLSTPSREICWRGFVYKAGLHAGEESLRDFAEAREEDIPRIAGQLKGAYFVAVRCHDSGNTYAFVDPCGLFHVYRSPSFIGTSFLEIARLEGCAAPDINPEALVEFFQFGCLYDDRTFFSNIHRIDPDVVLRSGAVGPVESLPKPLSDIAEMPQRSYETIMQEFVAAAKDERASMDITGGADTRLLATTLAYFGMPFEMATSGVPGLPDMEIGSKVAEALGRPFYPTYHSAIRTDWDEMFFLTGGMFDVTKNSRLIQLQKDRKSRGITLSISGVAGEFFREHWWMQDFPFYARRDPSLRRLYSLRIALQPLQHSLLGTRYKPFSENLGASFLRRIAPHAVQGNTKTYDRVYYYFQLRAYGGGFLSGSSSFLKSGIPFLDREIIRIGYNMPRTQRVFSRFNRKMITKYSRKAASLPTTEGGVTLSTGALPISMDLGRYLANRSKRLATKIVQQVLGKKFPHCDADDPRMIEELARTMQIHKSTQILADQGVLIDAVDPRALPRRYVGRVFVLGRFFEYLGESDQPQSARVGELIPPVRRRPSSYGIASCVSSTG